MKTLPKTLVLVNPAAGHGQGARVWRRVAAYVRTQGSAAEFVETRSAEEFERHAAQAAATGYSCVAALGGDGSFQLLLRATLGSGIILGLIPAGGGVEATTSPPPWAYRRTPLLRHMHC